MAEKKDKAPEAMEATVTGDVVVNKQGNEELVTITVNRRYEKDNRRYVCVNGRKCSILTGVPVKVPRWAARAIRQGDEQRDANRKMTAKLQKTAAELKF